MEQRDVVVAGGGIAGLAFAHHAAAAGRSVLVLEAGPRTGGCLNTRRLADGFWYEVGAHTAYNSYGAFLDLVEACGLRGAIRPRGEARKRFALLRDGRLAMMGPLSVFLKFDPIELLLTAPFGFFRSKEGPHDGRGLRRHRREAELRERPRAVPRGRAVAERRRVPRARPGLALQDARAPEGRREELHAGRRPFDARGRARPAAERGRADGRARARGAPRRRGLLRDSARTGPATRRTSPRSPCRRPRPRRSSPGAIRRSRRRSATIGSARVETTAVALPREKTSLPEMAFLVPVNDLFYSAVTRDPVPDAAPARLRLPLQAGPRARGSAPPDRGGARCPARGLRGRRRVLPRAPRARACVMQTPSRGSTARSRVRASP